MESRPTHVLTSPLLRAEQTAGIFVEEADLVGGWEPVESLIPGGSWRRTLAVLESVPTDHTVAVVGHEPDLGKLVGVLLFGAPRALPLKKAGACCIAFETKATAGAGELRWFLPPRILRHTARGRSES